MTVGSVGAGVSGKPPTFIMGRGWRGGGRQVRGFMGLPLKPGSEAVERIPFSVRISLIPQFTTLAILSLISCLVF